MIVIKTTFEIGSSCQCLCSKSSFEICDDGRVFDFHSACRFEPINISKAWSLLLKLDIFPNCLAFLFLCYRLCNISKNWAWTLCISFDFIQMCSTRQVVADGRDGRAGDLVGVDRHHDLVLLDLLLDDHHGAHG